MPAKSKAQQRMMGAALAVKRGQAPKSALRGPARQVVRSMTEAQIGDFAGTKTKKLPGHVRKK
jgi:Protein of unknwon function (DUF3008)